MALISSRGYYGLAAMHTLSRTPQDQPIPTQEIAKRANIPKNYLEQILAALKKAGLVHSIRGPRGGYFLTRAPEEISVLKIFEALEETLSVVDKPDDGSALGYFFADAQKEISQRFEMPLTELDQYSDIQNEYLHYSI